MWSELWPKLGLRQKHLKDVPDRQKQGCIQDSQSKAETDKYQTRQTGRDNTADCRQLGRSRHISKLVRVQERDAHEAQMITQKEKTDKRRTQTKQGKARHTARQSDRLAHEWRALQTRMADASSHLQLTNSFECDLLCVLIACQLPHRLFSSP